MSWVLIRMFTIITELFRIILDSGDIPNLWRTSFIMPLHKKGDKTEPNNYRPISLTCSLCRLFEKIILNDILEFLDDTNFFSTEQYGFLKNRSTTTQLLTTLNDFYNSTQKGLCTDVIYIDFAKAFDSVPDLCIGPGPSGPARPARPEPFFSALWVDPSWRWRKLSEIIFISKSHFYTSRSALQI
jgi:hypothetical protein